VAIVPSKSFADSSCALSDTCCWAEPSATHSTGKKT